MFILHDIIYLILFYLYFFFSTLPIPEFPSKKSKLLFFSSFAAMMSMKFGLFSIIVCFGR